MWVRVLFMSIWEIRSPLITTALTTSSVGNTVVQTSGKTSNISHTLVGNKIVDHSDDGRCSNYASILELTPGFNISHKDNCKTRRETAQVKDLVRLILEVDG